MAAWPRGLAAHPAIPATAQEDGGKTLSGAALIVGQAAYRDLPQLANPAQDARRMEELLGTLGYETTRFDDLIVRLPP